MNHYWPNRFTVMMALMSKSYRFQPLYACKSFERTLKIRIFQMKNGGKACMKIVSDIFRRFLLSYSTSPSVSIQTDFVRLKRKWLPSTTIETWHFSFFSIFWVSFFLHLHKNVYFRHLFVQFFCIFFTQFTKI